MRLLVDHYWQVFLSINHQELSIMHKLLTSTIIALLTLLSVGCAATNGANDFGLNGQTLEVQPSDSNSTVAREAKREEGAADNSSNPNDLGLVGEPLEVQPSDLNSTVARELKRQQGAAANRLDPNVTAVDPSDLDAPSATNGAEVAEGHLDCATLPADYHDLCDSLNFLSVAMTRFNQTVAESRGALDDLDAMLADRVLERRLSPDSPQL